MGNPPSLALIDRLFNEETTNFQAWVAGLCQHCRHPYLSVRAESILNEEDLKRLVDRKKVAKAALKVRQLF